MSVCCYYFFGHRPKDRLNIFSFRYSFDTLPYFSWKLISNERKPFRNMFSLDGWSETQQFGSTFCAGCSFFSPILFCLSCGCRLRTWCWRDVTLFRPCCGYDNLQTVARAARATKDLLIGHASGLVPTGLVFFDSCEPLVVLVRQVTFKIELSCPFIGSDPIQYATFPSLGNGN